MSDKTTYESLDNRIAPEALTEDHTKGLAVVDGHAVKSQEDYEDPDRLYGMLIARIRKYHPSTDVSLIEKAYKLAVEAHGDQRRKSGEPYIIHPLWVAIILADLEKRRSLQECCTMWLKIQSLRKKISERNSEQK